MIFIAQIDRVSSKETRPVEVPTTSQERKEFKQKHKAGTPVPETKWIKEATYLCKIGDELTYVEPTTVVGKVFPFEELSVLIVENKAGERFSMKANNLKRKDGLPMKAFPEFKTEVEKNREIIDGCKTIEELTELGNKRGYSTLWAQLVWAERK